MGWGWEEVRGVENCVNVLVCSEKSGVWAVFAVAVCIFFPKTGGFGVLLYGFAGWGRGLGEKNVCV